MAIRNATDRRVGLIGLGLVGTALAENLLAAGYEVVGFALNRTHREHLARLGGQPAANPAQVASAASRIILSLPDSAAVEQVILAPAGLLSGAARPSLILDMTTGEPEKSETLALLLAARGIQILDAPISGSSQQIRRRQGVVLVGGERAAYESCLDLLCALAEKFYHLGGSGAGSRGKLASNLILGLNRLALAEGLVFAERLGLDLAGFLAMLKETPAYSCAIDVKGQKMVEGEFSPQSKVSQHHKDLKIILDYAERSGQELPLAALHARLLEELIADGKGDLDTSAVLLVLQRLRHRTTAGSGGGTAFLNRFRSRKEE